MAAPSIDTVDAPDTALFDEGVAKLSDQYWRLNNLYWIKNEMGQRVKFRFNEVQEAVYRTLWYWNIYLKSRQHGITTFWCIYALDTCLFNGGITAAVIAHKLEDARKIFREKIKFPYENLPEEIRRHVPLDKDTGEEFVFGNGSSISVSMSSRSGTVQLLHISEFGYVCAKFPDKAQEIVNGALNSAHPGSMVSIESTAMGRSGKFYEYCTSAQKALQMKAPLGKLDFRFNFFGWFQDKKNRLDADHLVVAQRYMDYFKVLEDRHGIKLEPEQKAWYIARADKLGDDMLSEHPSTPDEAFKASVEGAYFKQQFNKIYAERRIGKIPHDPSVMVDTFWDLGVNDSTTIWFKQRVGREHHFIDYMEGSGEGLRYWKDQIDRKKDECGYRYGRHYAPHDIAGREWGNDGLTRHAAAARIGLDFEIVQVIQKTSRREEDISQIQLAREFLSLCYFDEGRCAPGIVHLESYRKEWDAIRGVFKDSPLHDEHSHGADSFLLAAVQNHMGVYDNHARRETVRRSSAGWT
jgi:hypothetical protein